MRLRTWPILALGFGSLVLLTLLFGLDNLRRMQQIYSTVLSIHSSQARVEESLRELESGVYLSELFTRDFLLDQSQLTAGLHRQKLLQLRTSMEGRLSELSDLIKDQRHLIDQLRFEINGYWDSLDPIFDWTPQQKIAFSSPFLRRHILPRREAVIEMAQKIKELTYANVEIRRRQIDARLADFRRSGYRMLAFSIGLGLIVSVASIFRIVKLETRSELQRIRTERAEQELRVLSQRLVRAQEDERRTISRELHDEVGQTVTALRVELGNLEKLRYASDNLYQEHMADAKGLAEQTLRSVRSLASGLRPSVLDDLGLGPALEWQAREVSRRTGIPVEVSIDGLPENLPEGHRTCLYRVVQEALTNCVRHSDAHHIRVGLQTESGRLSVTVQDDGRGISGNSAHQNPGMTPGIGLLGLEERVRELGGSVAIHSQRGKGTLLRVSVPLGRELVS